MKMGKKVVLVPGDGVGPEIASAAMAVLDSLVDDIEVIQADAGFNCYNRTGESLPIPTLESVDDCDAVLIGALANPGTRNYRDPLQEIKKREDLYANVRFIQKIVPDLGSADINVFFVREEDRSNSISEVEELDGASLTIKVNDANSKRVIQMAKRLAENFDMKVTCVHNATKHPVTNGIFLRTFKDVMEGSPVQYNDEGIEGAVSTMALEPSKYGLIVSLNPYSDILSAEAASLVGGAHLIPEAMLGEKMGLFRPMHGPTPRLEGLNQINPTAMLMATSKMLLYLGYRKQSDILKEAIRSAYKRGFRTVDVGGSTGTYDFGAQVARICETF